MRSKTTIRTRLEFVTGTVSLLLVLVFICLVGFRLISGCSLELRSFVSSSYRTLPNLPRAVLDSRNILALVRGEFTNVVFLHHSVGDNLIVQGDFIACGAYTVGSHS